MGDGRRDAVQLGVAKLAPGAGNVALAERPLRAPGAGEVTLAVCAVGICGTDLHIEAGEYPSVPPVTLGHEVCGVVTEAGPGDGGGLVGRRVVIETYASTCERCRYCRAGRRNLCAERRSLGTHVDGGMAPSVVVPARNLHRVPDWLGDHAAALCEPLACVANCLLSPAVVSAGDRVLVIGPGAIGLLAAQVARAGGGDVEVVGTERDGARMALAARLGFATAVAGAADDEREPVDVVVECSGSEGGVRAGLRALRRGGRYVQIGLRGADVTIPFDLVCFHELTITSGFASTPRSWATAMALVAERAAELPPLVSDVLPLERWDEAFARSRAGDGVKLVLDPRL
jgi:L-iditol 2-dehydrogenase